MIFKYNTTPDKILAYLYEKKVIKSVVKDLAYFDEPSLYRYGTEILFHSSKSYGSLPTHKYNASGISATTSEEALIKCLGEAMERFSLYHFSKQSIHFFSPNTKNIKIKTLPFIQRDENIIVGNVIGQDAQNGEKTYIPARFIFPNYVLQKKETPALSISSTGTAGGFDKTTTLIRAVCEAVERDVVMSAYLLKSGWTRIDPSTLPVNLARVYGLYKKYRLDVYLYCIQNEFEMPTVVTFLVDRSGLGPYVSVGAKTELDVEKAIMGSFEEASLTRPWLRMVFSKKDIVKGRKTSPITTLQERAFYWYRQDRLHKLDFVFNLKLHPLKKLDKKTSLTTRERWKNIIKRINRCGYSVYYYDLTHPFFKTLGYCVFRVIIPGLQSRYMDERHKIINKSRLRHIASYYKMRSIVYNSTPHPFL